MSHQDPEKKQEDALFAEINKKGDSITSGLKHVTDDLKVHKQPKKDPQMETESKAKKLPAAASLLPKGKAASVSLQAQKNWLVENYHGNLEEDPVVAEVEPERRHAVLIRHCTHATIVVKTKSNTVSILKCYGVTVQLSGTVGSVEVTSCEDCEIVFAQPTRQVILGNSRSIQIHHNSEDLPLTDMEFVTSQCATINVTTMAQDPEGQPGEMTRREFALPEQFEAHVGPKNQCISAPSILHEGCF